MRLTFTDIYELAQDLTGQDTSTNSLTFLKQAINRRYELAIDKLPSRFSEKEHTFTTAADTQDYDLPPNIRKIQNVKITIGSVDYDLDPVFSQDMWDRLNAISFQGGAIPTKYFTEQSTIGIWPIPQGTDTVTIKYNFRASGMVNDDYVTGTVTVTNDDATVTGAATTFTGGNANAGQWFSLADSNGESKGDWYEIDSITDGTNLELTRTYTGTTSSGESYIIGDSPDLPPELHPSLAFGAVADYFAGFKQSPTKAQTFENMFWTGDYNNSSREPTSASGGVLGFIREYEDRDDSQLVKRGRQPTNSDFKVFATDLSLPRDKI